MGYTIVHFVRHAQSINKTPIPPPNAENIHDPDLSPAGKQDCESLSNTVQNNDYITHMFCSPMQRAISTARLSFGKMIDRQVTELGREFTIFAMPALQTLGSGANGCGLDLAPLLELVKSESGKGVVGFKYLDVVSFMTPMWNQKECGVWSADESGWRVEYVKAALRGLPKKKRVEVVVVSHSSFLKKIIPEHPIRHAEMKTFLFENDSFQLLTEGKLEDLRRGSDEESREG